VAQEYVKFVLIFYDNLQLTDNNADHLPRCPSWWQRDGFRMIRISYPDPENPLIPVRTKRRLAVFGQGRGLAIYFNPACHPLKKQPLSARLGLRRELQTSAGSVGSSDDCQIRRSMGARLAIFHVGEASWEALSLLKEVVKYHWQRIQFPLNPKNFCILSRICLARVSLSIFLLSACSFFASVSIFRWLTTSLSSLEISGCALISG